MQSKIDMGLALLEVQNWQKISVDDDFFIVSEKKWLRDTVHFSISSNFMEIFDSNSQNMLQGMAAKATPEQVDSSILFTHDGSPLEVILIRRENTLDLFVRNIEDRLRALEHYTIFYRHFLTTPTAICFTDNNAKIIDANKAFLDLYGYRQDELIGQNPRILKSNRQSPTVYQEMWDSLTNSPGGSWSGEIINRGKSGKEYTIHLTISRVLRSNGYLIGYVGSSIDISREKRLEESLKTKNDELVALESLNIGLMSFTSSELKTPLNGIISRATLIKETIDVSSREKLLEQVGWIISESTRMTMLVSDFFEAGEIVPRRSRLTTTRIRLDSVLCTCIDINTAIAVKNEIKISLEILTSPEPVLVEVGKMERVFNTLISNAVKSSPSGSVVSVRYRDCPEGILVEIQDQGSWFLEEDLDMMFDRYFRVKKIGALSKRALGIGLSLNIAKNIVELHGGKIKARNLQSGGCIFSVMIPTGLSIVSGSDVAALIHDPSGNIFSCLERPLKANKASCFITKTASEARRVFTYEKPDLAFFSSESLTPELRSLCVETQKVDGSRTEFILVAHGDYPGQDNLFSRVLRMPVNDVDVLSILKGHHAKPSGGVEETCVSSIIIMDHDDTTHDVLGEYLRGAGYEIRHAYHPAEALKLQSISRSDLILLDEEIQEMDGFKLLETIKNNPLLRDVPVIFLGENRPGGDDKRAKTGRDYIYKPFSKIEVLACVKTNLQKNVRTQKIEKVLEGNLAHIKLPTLLQTLEIDRKSLQVRLDDIDGEIRIANGMFVSARQGAFCGDEAFLRILFLEKGGFSVLISNYHPETTEAAISIESLLMKSVVYLDEVRLLLAGLPAEGTLLNVEGGVKRPSELDNIFLPCPLQELLIQMNGELKINAEFIANALLSGLLKTL